MNTVGDQLNLISPSALPYRPPRRIEWNPDLVAKFWDFQASRPDLHVHYFSKLVGGAVVRFAQDQLGQLGRVADFGSGPGYLLEQLADSAERFWALDYSPESLKRVQERFGSNERFAGTALIHDETSDTLRVDTVFCIETLEHLFPDNLLATIKFIRSILKPNGNLIVTVPNQEQLELNDICCPCCNTVFHRWQHLSSWRAEKLDKVLTEQGFQTRFCSGIDLFRMQKSLVANNRLSRRIWHRFLNVIDTRKHVESIWGIVKKKLRRSGPADDFRVPPPNLVYVGKRLP